MKRPQFKILSSDRLAASRLRFATTAFAVLVPVIWGLPGGVVSLPLLGLSYAIDDRTYRSELAMLYKLYWQLDKEYQNLKAELEELRSRSWQQ